MINHTLDSAKGEASATLHHFWLTGARDKIDRVWVEYYIDGEETPSIAFQPSMMCGVAFPKSLVPPTKEFGAGAICGKTAPVGGWFNTIPVPFYKSALVTVRADPQDGDGCFGGYLNVRGTVNLPAVMPGSGLPLPADSDGGFAKLRPRLWLQRNEMAVRQPLEYVTVAQLPAGTRGVVLGTSWAVESRPVGGSGAGGGYIEGCWTFYRAHNESFPGLVVGTGVEDYFDSAYYFGADSGNGLLTFQTPLNGLTVGERTDDGIERLSAYRFHASDPLAMADGGRLVWRVGAQGEPGTTKCGNPIPAQGQPTDGLEGLEGLEGLRVPPLGRAAMNASSVLASFPRIHLSCRT